jgi:hypothetical protein
VLDVVRLGERRIAQRKSARRVTCIEGPPNRRRECAPLAPNVEHVSVGIVFHLDHARITGDPPRRFRGNAVATIEHGLPRCARVPQDGFVDVHDDLVPIGTAPRIELVL